MSDIFLDKLQARWRKQDAEFALVQARIRRRRWQPHLLLAVELAGSLVMLIAGLMFAWAAFRYHSLLFGLSAAVMLLTAPVAAVGAVLTRKDSLRWEDETPEGVLNAGLRHADASLRAIRAGRWNSAVIGAFVAVLWLAEVLGYIHARVFLVFYTTLCAVLCVGVILWLRWREQRIRAEREVCRRLLDDLRLP